MGVYVLAPVPVTDSEPFVPSTKASVALLDTGAMTEIRSVEPLAEQRRDRITEGIHHGFGLVRENRRTG